MADKTAKAKKNVSGSYYVDSSCISCFQCFYIAEDFFAEDPDGGLYVKCQPSLDSEVALCEKALVGCPVGAIGNDG